jgi:hypothetical protein
MINAVSVEAQALEQMREVLSASATLQVAFGVDGDADPAASLRELVWFVDVDDSDDMPLQTPYVLAMALPGGQEELAKDVISYAVDVAVELWFPLPSGADHASDDFVAGLNLTDVLADIRTQERAGALNFELGLMTMSEPVRDDEVAGEDTAGDIGVSLQVALEAFDNR